MSFTKLKVDFSLKDIGSEIIDQLSTDVYTGPGSIIRELVKNAYDAYLGLDADDFDDEMPKRQIVISRERGKDKVGRLMIADQGIGQSKDDLKANVQISISRKTAELDHATGFRGLGSWATLGAGSRIIITSSKKKDPFENRLIIDVRKVYGILGPNTTLDDILNNSECVAFHQRPADVDEHFTTVEIECDGKVSSINRHEFNRLYPFTDPEDIKLRQLVVEHCPIPFPKHGEIYKQVHDIYRDANYVPTALVLDGVALERTLPEDLINFKIEKLKIGGKVAAIGWTADDPDESREVGRLIEEKHNLGSPSIQLVKLNVPIGPKGQFSDNVRAGILDWYVGEIHILAGDVLPDAGGDKLRDGTARDAFIGKVREWYEELEKDAERKSERLSLEKHFKKAKDAAERIEAGGLTPVQVTQEMQKVGKVVEILDQLSKRGPSQKTSEQRIREAAKHPDVQKAKKEAAKVLKDTGLLDKLKSGVTSPSAIDPKNAKTPKAAASAKTTGTSSKINLTKMSSIQAKVAQAIPKLNQLGLTKQQVNGVMEIIEELLGNA